jgi:hypothetical protein
MSDDALLMVTSIEITTQKKKGNNLGSRDLRVLDRKGERPRSDTTTEPRTAVNLITAETFTKIFGNTILVTKLTFRIGKTGRN